MTALRFTAPYFVAVDESGAPLPGALLNFYVTGTSNRTNTYSDAALTVPNSNPVVADAGGMFPNIFMDPGIVYKVVLTDQFDDELWAADPYTPGELTGLNTTASYPNDALAAIGGVAVGQIYRNGSVVQIRVA